MIVILGKIISMFAIVFVGYGANRLNWLPNESVKYLSNLLINIAAPCVMLVALNGQELTHKTASLTGIILLLTLGLCVLCTALGFLVVKILKIPLDRQGVYVFSLTYSNNGFLGMAVAQTVFGSQGMFVMVIANIALGVCIYTIGMLTVTYGTTGKVSFKDSLKSMWNVPLGASVLGLLLFLLQIRLPGMAVDFMSLMGNMMVPLSMVIIGVQLADSGLLYTLKQKGLYNVSLLRLVVMPAIVFPLMLALRVPVMVTAVMTLTAALPPASLGPVLTAKYGGNTTLAAGCVSLGTFFSLFSVPAVCGLLVAYVS